MTFALKSAGLTDLRRYVIKNENTDILRDKIIESTNTLRKLLDDIFRYSEVNKIRVLCSDLQAEDSKVKQDDKEAFVGIRHDAEMLDKYHNLKRYLVDDDYPKPGNTNWTPERWRQVERLLHDTITAKKKLIQGSIKNGEKINPDINKSFCIEITRNLLITHWNQIKQFNKLYSEATIDAAPQWYDFFSSFPVDKTLNTNLNTLALQLNQYTSAFDSMIEILDENDDLRTILFSATQLFKEQLKRVESLAAENKHELPKPKVFVDPEIYPGLRITKSVYEEYRTKLSSSELKK